jgi:MFS transporter, SP family, general alpha glucoside:H+ symporter
LDIQDTVALMVHTNKIEAKFMKNGLSYASLFRGANRRRTEIACIVWACQALCGAALTSYALYFLVQAGFDPSHPFSLTIGRYGLSIIGGIIAWGLLSVVGRRKLYLSGLAAAGAILAACGYVAVLVRVEAGRN